MRVPAVVVALSLLCASSAFADEAPADPAAPRDTEAEWRARANPEAFVEPQALRTFRRCADPFQIARGPVEVRDMFALAEVRMALPAMSPDVLERGRWLLRLHGDVGNDFGFSQTGPAESPTSDRRFLVDTERHSLELDVRHGLGRWVDVGVRVPLLWRGGGYLDGLIDWWHRRWGLANNSRDLFYANAYRIEGRDAAGQKISWDEHGWGLGNVELDARWELLHPATRKDWRGALIGRVSLPTGTGPFETGGVDLGLQAVGAKQLARRWDLYGGLGGTWFPDDEVRGIVYEPVHGHAFLALEWRPVAYMSVLLQSDVSTRLVSNLVDYPDVQWYVHLGTKVDLGRGWRLTGGLTENLVDQQSTSDVDFWGGLEVVF